MQISEDIFEGATHLILSNIESVKKIMKGIFLIFIHKPSVSQIVLVIKIRVFSLFYSCLGIRVLLVIRFRTLTHVYWSV